METKILHNMINILTLTMLVLLVSLSQAKTSKHSLKHLRIDLMHIDSKGNFSRSELLQRMTRRSHQRMIHLSRKTNNLRQHDSKQATGAQTDAYLGSGEFVMDIAIGTPSKSFPAIIDTGSDLVWTQCKPCKRCFKQSTSIFDPSKSSTYKKLPCTAKLCKALPTQKCGKRNASCEYLYGYADQSFTVGNLASETFTLGSQSVKNIAFGCGNNNTDGFDKSSGLVGLGREPLSLISQLGFKKFSYCFASLNLEKHSPMFFGSLAHLNASAAAGPTQTTPLVKNPIYPSFYYLSLLGVTIGSTKLNIPSSTFALNKTDGTGGMIIDSGTTFTYLEAVAYNAAKKAFISQMKIPVADGSDIGFDVCFKPPKSASLDLPKFILHFDGADLDLPESNYIFHDSDTGLLCLTITASAGISILGNMQQQNFFIKYDLGKNKLSFIPTQCDKL
ncbi:aspartic proteinase nepenthesin-2 [Carex littledalei]|uniref:Aspartic proteinase nepenthesin-2 n=1 Tax=Carex littledalei TaxID=544730 RepID=A0A833VZF4_9POAL|nr:aspartic proteinase nepenthesin-2 [Carex littledalei]